MTRETLNLYTDNVQEKCRKNDAIDPQLYDEYGVFRGLRDMGGNGVLTGLTNISKIVASKTVDGQKVPCDGQLWYRGYRVEDLISSSSPPSARTRSAMRRSPTCSSSASCPARRRSASSAITSALAGLCRRTSPATSS